MSKKQITGINVQSKAILKNIKDQVKYTNEMAGTRCKSVLNQMTTFASTKSFRTQTTQRGIITGFIKSIYGDIESRIGPTLNDINSNSTQTMQNLKNVMESGNQDGSAIATDILTQTKAGLSAYNDNLKQIQGFAGKAEIKRWMTDNDQKVLYEFDQEVKPEFDDGINKLENILSSLNDSNGPSTKKQRTSGGGTNKKRTKRYKRTKKHKKQKRTKTRKQEKRKKNKSKRIK